MKNSEKGPLIIVTAGVAMILAGFIFFGEPKVPAVAPPLPPPPKPPQSSAVKDGVAYGPACVWVKVVNASVFSTKALLVMAESAKLFVPDSPAAASIRTLFQAALACQSDSMMIHDVDGTFSVNALLTHLGTKTIAQVLAENLLGTHPANSVLGVVKTTLQGVQPNVLS